MEEAIQNNPSSLLKRFKHWQDHWREPMLTGLLVMLTLEVFVNIPLSGSHFSALSIFTVIELFLIISAVIVASRNRVLTIIVLFSSAVALLGNTMRIENPTTFNILLSSTCSVI